VTAQPPAGQSLPPVDTGNPLLAPAQALLGFAVADGPKGKLLVATIRTATTTLTIHLGPNDAQAWAQSWAEAAGSMSSGIIVAHGSLPHLPLGPSLPLNGGQ
jgi:hypothetical protein